MAFDFTCLATFQANSSAVHSASVGARWVLTSVALRSSDGVSARLRQKAAARCDFTTSDSAPRATFISRRFFLACRIASASAE